MEFIKSIAILIITSMFPIAVYFLGQLIEDLAARYFSKEIADAVASAVRYVNQTLVDDLKAEDDFENCYKYDAFQEARQKTMALLSRKAKMYLDNNYKDSETVIGTLIESEVKRQKM